MPYLANFISLLHGKKIAVYGEIISPKNCIMQIFSWCEIWLTSLFPRTKSCIRLMDISTTDFSTASLIWKFHPLPFQPQTSTTGFLPQIHGWNSMGLKKSGWNFLQPILGLYPWWLCTFVQRQTTDLIFLYAIKILYEVRFFC
jgi:hypothetical protein